jgi:Zn finger protein HypA/HybF involved in hydrogenase expression
MDDAEELVPCEFCGHPFDHETLGRYGCPNCEGEGLE